MELILAEIIEFKHLLSQMLFIMKGSYFQQQYMLNQVIAGLAKSHFFLKLSNKMRKRRKQSIFDFNHIDPSLREEELEEIKNLFRFYHKRFWCLKRAHGRFKKMNLLINLTSSGLVAIGTIAGGVTMNPIVLGVISGLGLVVKTASEMKNLKSKIEMSKFAFTTYEKTLIDLRFALRGGNFDQTEFLSSMEAIDGIVIDLGLDLEKFENEWKEKFSTE